MRFAGPKKIIISFAPFCRKFMMYLCFILTFLRLNRFDLFAGRGGSKTLFVRGPLSWFWFGVEIIFTAALPCGTAQLSLMCEPVSYQYVDAAGGEGSGPPDVSLVGPARCYECGVQRADVLSSPSCGIDRPRCLERATRCGAAAAIRARRVLRMLFCAGSCLRGAGGGGGPGAAVRADAGGVQPAVGAAPGWRRPGRQGRPRRGAGRRPRAGATARMPPPPTPPSQPPSVCRLCQAPIPKKIRW